MKSRRVNALQLRKFPHAANSALNPYSINRMIMPVNAKIVVCMAFFASMMNLSWPCVTLADSVGNIHYGPRIEIQG